MLHAMCPHACISYTRQQAACRGDEQTSKHRPICPMLVVCVAKLSSMLQVYYIYLRKHLMATSSKRVSLPSYHLARHTQPSSLSIDGSQRTLVATGAKLLAATYLSVARCGVLKAITSQRQNSVSIKSWIFDFFERLLPFLYVSDIRTRREVNI
jgi:hypothetical protein